MISILNNNSLKINRDFTVFYNAGIAFLFSRTLVLLFHVGKLFTPIFIIVSSNKVSGIRKV